MSKPSVKVVFLFSFFHLSSKLQQIAKKIPSGSKWWFPLQELKIRKGTGRGRGRRSKREADDEGLEEKNETEEEAKNKEEQEEYYVDEGDFGFVEVWQVACSKVRNLFQGWERRRWGRESAESGSAGLGWRLQSLPEGRGPTSCNLLKYWNVPSTRSSRCWKVLES